jgi:hypothetical protein
MRRTWIVVSVLALFLGGVGLLSGCAKKSQDEAMTTVDSTLALGGQPSDVPPPGPTPGEQYSPPPGAPSTGTPQSPAPKTTRPPTSSTPGRSKGPAMVTVPAGTAIELELSTPLNTKTATANQEFTATVAEDVEMDGQVVIPRGATVNGHVLVTQRSGKASGKAYMQLAYDDIAFGGKTYTVESVGDTMFGKGGSGKDAKMIGGGAAAGAVIGGLLGGSAGSAVKGAVVGAAGGTAASLLTRGPDLDLKAGKKVNLTLESSLQVPKPKTGA